MTLTSLLPLVAYAFVMSITPGPNNLLLAASGLRFGLRQTIPLWLGINAGFASLLTLCSIGVGALIISVPEAQLALRIIGTSYLLYLAWQMKDFACAVGPEDTEVGQPISASAAALFQFVNPKGWVMAVSASSVFFPNVQPYALAIALLVGIFVVISMVCGVVWLLIGFSMGRLLASHFWRIASSWMMLLLILGSVLGIWI